MKSVSILPVVVMPKEHSESTHQMPRPIVESSFGLITLFALIRLNSQAALQKRTELALQMLYHATIRGNCFPGDVISKKFGITTHEIIDALGLLDPDETEDYSFETSQYKNESRREHGDVAETTKSHWLRKASISTMASSSKGTNPHQVAPDVQSTQSKTKKSTKSTSPKPAEGAESSRRPSSTSSASPATLLHHDSTNTPSSSFSPTTGCDLRGYDDYAPLDSRTTRCLRGLPAKTEAAINDMHPFFVNPLVTVASAESLSQHISLSKICPPAFQNPQYPYNFPGVSSYHCPSSIQLPHSNDGGTTNFEDLSAWPNMLTMFDEPLSL